MLSSEQEQLGQRIIDIHRANPDMTASQVHDLLMRSDPASVAIKHAALMLDFPYDPPVKNGSH